MAGMGVAQVSSMSDKRLLANDNALLETVKPRPLALLNPTLGVGFVTIATSV